jgi:hypothetical protein
MGNTFGRQVLDQVGVSLQLSADGQPQVKPGGITLDWTTIAAVGADTIFPSGFFVPAGQKYIRYGQVVNRIVAAAQVQTVTVTGTPTGGTFTLQGIRYDTGATGTAVIPYNATAAVAQPLLDAIFGAGNTTVGGGALPGAALTVTFNGVWGNGQQVMTVPTTAFIGGATPAATVAITTPGNTSGGLWGPYDPAATDGRQTLSRADTVLINESKREIDLKSNHPVAIQGGLVWRERILATNGTASLAAGPTYAALEAVMPNLLYAKG